MVWVLLGIILYSLGRTIVRIDFHNELLYKVFMGGGLCITFGSIVVNWRRFYLRKPLNNGIFRSLCILLLAYMSVLLLDGIISNPSKVVEDLRSPVRILGYLTIFVLLISPNEINMRNVFRLSYISSLLIVVYILGFFREIFFTSHVVVLRGYDIEEMSKGQFPGFFAFPAGFLLMNYKFISKKYRIVAIAAIALSIGASIAYGRRGNAGLLIALGLCALYMYVVAEKAGFIKKALVVLIFIAGGVYLYTNSATNPLFEVMSERIMVDSRGSIEDDLIRDLNQKPIDWFIGRGLHGSYYTMVVDDLTRYSMETAYLRIILNGGVVLLGLYLIIAIRAFYLGFFKARNFLCKAMSLYILISILFLVASFSPFDFSLRGVLLWISIAFCYSYPWRMKTNDEILTILKTK